MTKKIVKKTMRIKPIFPSDFHINSQRKIINKEAFVGKKIAEEDGF